jgi:5-methylcytosine-specific restriction protein A
MPMFKVCSQCGMLHDFNADLCQARRVKKDTKAVRFRNTSRWQRKRKEIRERDRHLCQVCLLDIYDTRQMYTYDNIEVNHIVPINEDITKALDDDNLLSLCSFHHKMADRGKIPRAILVALTRPDRNLEDIKQRASEP